METIFDTWMKNANNMTAEWKKMNDEWSKEGNKMWENASNMQQQWLNSYQDMLKGFNSTSANPFMNETTREAFSNMLKSMDVYTRLFKMWQPFFNRMQTEGFNPQEFWKGIDPSQFRSFVDTLFGMNPNAMLQTFMEQCNRMMPLWMNSMKQTAKTYNQWFNNSGSFFNATAGMNPQSGIRWFTEMARGMQRSLFPYYMPTDNGTAPTQEPFSGMIERWGNYMSKTAQMQTMLYKTSMAAWEKTAQAVADRASNGQPFDNFNEFYNQWATINEQEYMALFNTEEYSRLQNEVLVLQTELAKQYERSMEALLQPYPVVLRSQLDEVYKVNHELRSRINELERMIAELQRTAKSSVGKGEKTATKE